MNPLAGLLPKKLTGKKGARVNIPASSAPSLFGLVWERKRQPSPGAMQYAYESLALAPTTPIGAGVAVRRPLAVDQGEQLYVGQSVPVQGIPTVAGTVVTQPLFVPDSGVGILRSGMGIGNNPYPKFDTLPVGALT